MPLSVPLSQLRAVQAVEDAEWLGSLDRPHLHGEHMYWCAAIAAALGKRERAVDLLRQAFAEGYEIILETADEKEIEVTVAPDGTILEEDTGEAK